jgi:hypothetical protein
MEQLSEEKRMPAQYEKLGIRFLYPENWRIEDEDLDEWPRRVSVQSPGGGYWELHVYPSRISPADLSKQVVEAMREVYEDLESEPVTEQMWNVTAQGYDLDFFCLDLLVTSQVRSFYVGARTYVLIYQAENREFEQQRPVFAAITKSLLDG